MTDDRRLFEKLCLEGFQSGLSWLTILRKREAFRSAFAGFDFERVARFGEADVERLLGDAAIVRHRGKIEATINNARRAVELVEAEGSLAAFVWRFEPDPAAPSASARERDRRSRARWRRSSSAAAGASSARPRSTRSCRRWAWSTTTSRAATRASRARARAQRRASRSRSRRVTLLTRPLESIRNSVSGFDGRHRAEPADADAFFGA